VNGNTVSMFAVSLHLQFGNDKIFYFYFTFRNFITPSQIAARKKNAFPPPCYIDNDDYESDFDDFGQVSI